MREGGGREREGGWEKRQGRGREGGRGWEERGREGGREGERMGRERVGREREGGGREGGRKGEREGDGANHSFKRQYEDPPNHAYLCQYFCIPDNHNSIFGTGQSHVEAAGII